MKVFISWSGERSRAVAGILGDWTRRVIQAVKPWISTRDIEKGTRWNPELSQQLEATRFGLICLTPENREAPWILFEAGALSKTLEHTYVCPVLFNLAPKEVEPPLTQFQLTTLEKEDMFELMRTMNNALAQLSLEQSLRDEDLREAFFLRWPQLEEQLKKIPPTPALTTKTRSTEDMVEELLGLVRGLARSQRTDVDRLRQLEAIHAFLLQKLTATARAQLIDYLQADPTWRNVTSLDNLLAFRREESPRPESDSPAPKESPNKSESSAT